MLSGSEASEGAISSGWLPGMLRCRCAWHVAVTFSWHAVCWLPLLACRIPLIRPGSAGQPPGVALI